MGTVIQLAPDEKAPQIAFQVSLPHWGQVAEDDIVVTWFTMLGTHQGEWGGIKPTNKMLTLRGVNVQRFRDGRIVEQWGGANTLEALLEIGAIRLPCNAPD